MKNRGFEVVKGYEDKNINIPVRSTSNSAGYDIEAAEDIILPKYEVGAKPTLIPTGLHIALPEGYEAQIRPRSGLAIKKGITCLNTPGTIDADYRGDVGVILINLSAETFVVNPGDRIAQMIINKFEQAEFELVEELDETERGEGGYGHTGVK